VTRPPRQCESINLLPLFIFVSLFLSLPLSFSASFFLCLFLSLPVSFPPSFFPSLSLSLSLSLSFSLSLSTKGSKKVRPPTYDPKSGENALPHERAHHHEFGESTSQRLLTRTSAVVFPPRYPILLSSAHDLARGARRKEKKNPKQKTEKRKQKRTAAIKTRTRTKKRTSRAGFRVGLLSLFSA